MPQESLKNKLIVPLPRELQIEPTTKCNLDCVMCSRETRYRKSSRDMTYVEFRNLIDSVPTLKKVHFHGLGESLYNKHFFDMVKYMKKRGIFVCFNDNATLLDKEKSLELIKSGLDEMRISIDTANPKTYAKIRGKDVLDSVIRNIKQLQSLKSELNSDKPALKIVTVLMKETLNDMRGIVKLAGQLGIDRILVQNVQTWSGDVMTDKSEKSTIGIKKNKIFEVVKKLANKYGIKFSYPKEKMPYTCTWMFESAFITCEGYVTPCCNCPNPNVFNFGNLKDKSFPEIWNSKKYQNFRKRHINKNFPNICKDCVILKGTFKDYEEDFAHQH